MGFYKAYQLETKQGEKKMSKIDNIKEQDTENYTHIVVVLDKSWSMAGLTQSTIAGFNGFMKEQKNVMNKATVSLMQFAGDQNWSYEMMPVKETVEINTESYVTNGDSTALCDSIAKAVHRTEDKIKTMELAPNNVVVVIITDGQENSSQEFKKEHISKIIEAHEDEGWDFVFLGANQDAISEGGSIGVRASNSMTYGASSDGVEAMYASVSKSLTSYRSSRSSGHTDQIGFFVEEETKVVD